MKKTLTEIRKEFQSYYFDRKAAARVIHFFENRLTHAKGASAGQKFILERWEKRILRRLFGWKRRADGLRKYKVLYLEIPRKNGKSTLGAGLALYLLDADKEAGAEVISAAADSDQAAIVFETAKEMVSADETLTKRIVTYRRSMAVHTTASSYKVISATPKTKHGTNLHAFLVDELHAQDNRDLIDVLVTSMAYRSQPLQIFFTTAGYDKNSICYEYHDYALKVKEGIIRDPTFLPVIFAANEPEKNTDPLWWTKEKVWREANPNLGVTVRLDYLKEQCEKAKEIPAYENTFKRLHLNIWTEQDSRWIPIEKWDACKADFKLKDLYGKECIAGIDLASNDDITAALFLFRNPDNTFRVLPYFWLPEESMKRRSKKDKVAYEEWARLGLIEITKDRPTTDYAYIRKRFNELRTQFNIREVVMDKWNADQFANQLMDDNFEVMYWGMGMATMTAPTKRLNSLILSKDIQHDGNEVLRWMAKNVAIEQDAEGNIKPSKRKSKEKIDGIVAIIMALGRWMTNSEFKSVYETRGIRDL